MQSTPSTPISFIFFQPACDNLANSLVFWPFFWTSLISNRVKCMEHHESVIFYPEFTSVYGSRTCYIVINHYKPRHVKWEMLIDVKSSLEPCVGILPTCGAMRTQHFTACCDVAHSGVDIRMDRSKTGVIVMQNTISELTVNSEFVIIHNLQLSCPIAFLTNSR